VSFSIDHALRVEIEDDYELCKKMLDWQWCHPEIWTFRGGSSGRGSYIGWFPAEFQEELNLFFAEATED
jgi:hypothetical protein